MISIHKFGKHLHEHVCCQVMRNAYEIGSTRGLGWGDPTHTLVPWRHGFKHQTRNECMGWFAQIEELGQCLIF